MAEPGGLCYIEVMQTSYNSNSPQPPRRRFRQIPVRMLVPNLITLLALCAGLTAIRLSTENRMELAVARSCSPPCWTESTAASRA